jgi:hypothetical protein
MGGGGVYSSGGPRVLRTLFSVIHTMPGLGGRWAPYCDNLLKIVSSSLTVKSPLVYTITHHLYLLPVLQATSSQSVASSAPAQAPRNGTAG